MSSVGPVLSLLREETGEIHRRLDTRMDAIARLADAGARNDLVQRYYAFYCVVENAVAPLAAGMALKAWRRAPLLEAAMDTLRLRALPAPPSMSLSNGSQALGALYVLIGSALGGRMILKDLAGRGADRRGLEFLDPYGDAVGETWRNFIITLERDVSDPGQAAIGALAAFAQAEDILCLRQAA